MMNYIDVAAAVIIIDGRILMSTRPPGKHLAGYWEFPGGKVAENETLGNCIVREIKEELDVDVLPFDVMFKIEHHYIEKSVKIVFVRCQPKNLNDFTPVPQEGQEVDFFELKDIHKLNIVPADKPLIDYLQKFED